MLGLIALMATLSFVVGGIVAVVTSEQGVAINAAKARLVAATRVAGELSEAINHQTAAIDDYVFTRSAAVHTVFIDSLARERVAAARIPEVTDDSSEVRGALDALEAATLDWQGRVAAPAVTAVRLGDEVAIARFASQADHDQDRIHTANDTVRGALDRVAEDIGRRQSSAGVTSSIGIGIAFGFLAVAFGVALFVVRRFGRALERDARQASVLNRFTEVTSFALDDGEVARANLVALGRLAKPDASVTHILNRSMDRAVPEASTGDAIADVLPLRALDRCAGVLRGTMYVADDLADDLSVHCPIYPATTGTLACVPLDSGEMVGSVHLYWRRSNALGLDRRPAIARVTEHAALSIGNRRMLAALHGQANTDPRTGLANSRAFDLALETALTSRAGHEPLSVLMLDVDHFKDFNDRQGHPAGDEALKTFGAVLRSCMREGDVAARYGGEEFAVLLPGIDGSVAAEIAERIRARTEATVLSLSPGITDHITISIGVASAPDQGLDRVTLMRLADEALYQAKDQGRNRVAWILDPTMPPRLVA